jgi:murein hydrolase activator
LQLRLDERPARQIGARLLLGIVALVAAVSIVRAETAAIDAASAKVSVPKQKLTQVQRDLAKKREDLERYKQKMSRLQEKLGQEQDRVHAFRSERESLEHSRRSAAFDRRRLKARLAAIENRLQQSLASAGGAAELLYTRTVLADPYYGSSSLWATAALENAVSSQLESCRRIESRFESAFLQSKDAEKKADELSSRSRQTRDREREARLALKRRKRDVEATRRRLALAEGRVKELEATSVELDRLVARLSRRAESGPLGRHSLPWPAEGDLVARFGRQRVEGFGTWVVHHGIRLSTEPGAEVTPVRPGRVVYAGPFRSYGDVVIVDHGGGFVTVYGHLGQVLKAAGDEVGIRDVIGTAGQSLGAEAQLVKLPEGRGSVYFEIRKGNLAVDPLKWLRRR